MREMEKKVDGANEPNKANKEQFTPGPWKVVRVKEDIDTFAIRTQDDDTLAAVGISPAGWKPGKDIANARLIAAAPEMYEMLDHIEDVLDDSSGCGEISVEEIRKLLKKARGDE